MLPSELTFDLEVSLDLPVMNSGAIDRDYVDTGGYH